MDIRAHTHAARITIFIGTHMYMYMYMYMLCVVHVHTRMWESRVRVYSIGDSINIACWGGTARVRTAHMHGTCARCARACTHECVYMYACVLWRASPAEEVWADAVALFTEHANVSVGNAAARRHRQRGAESPVASSARRRRPRAGRRARAPGGGRRTPLHVDLMYLYMSCIGTLYSL